MRFQLIASPGDLVHDLPTDGTVVVGRALQCDIPVMDATISRRHAELSAGDDGVHVRDLSSSNGTFVNGRRVETAIAVDGDELTFGKVSFVVRFAAPALEVSAAPDRPPASISDAHPLTSETILRARPVAAPVSTVGPLRVRSDALSPGSPTGIDARPEPSPVVVSGAEGGGSGSDRTRRRLELLVTVAHKLGRARDTDALLSDVVEMVFDILEADRAAVLIVNADGELTPVVARSREGASSGSAVPRSIARRVVDERVAILSGDAPGDQRFGGASIILQQVRSAICAPLLGSDGEPLGVLYVDNRTLTHRYGDDDLDFVIAFAGLAGIALENSRFAERLRHEALIRVNFERYFPPALAARIADDPQAVRLGGGRRNVAVLFSDIRDFTALAESMRPDDVAALLSEYFTRMVECVFRHGGTLDKFIGDAMLAQWGAPIGAEDDAGRALATAIAMQRELTLLNAGWRTAGRPELGVGMGLSFGEVFAGNIGSERRMEYTIIGDTVNVASRLSAAAGAGEILITDELRQQLIAPPALEECAPLALRGKTQPVPVFRVSPS